MSDFLCKQGDTAPAWTDTLTYSNGSAVDLTGASVKFVMRSRGQLSPTTNNTATVVTPAAGTVSYTPTATDTANAGTFAAYWVVTFGNGTVQRFPTVGYLEVEIQENLETPNRTIVELDEVKDYLNFPTTDRYADRKLLQFIASVTPVVENITGPVLPQKYVNETYDGGSWFISLRHRPVMSVESVTEYRGPIPYVLQQVLTPDQGTIYSYEFDGSSRLIRRTVGGGITSFPPGADQVWVTYTAGRSPIPENIRMGTLELLRVNYQQTQQGFGSNTRPSMGDEFEGYPMLGFFVPGRVRELLAPSRKHPPVA